MDALRYARELIAFESTSMLSNAPVSDSVQETLRSLGFETERIEYHDQNGVLKVSIVGKKGAGRGGMAYFGHTDVVPADDWLFEEHGPFEPTVVDDRLYGRGACDMKGSVACMLAAAARFAPEQLRAPIYITCTADEEIGYGGAAAVARESRLYREMVTGHSRSIIGEPTMLDVVYAHKGSYGFRATAHGRAAHSSTSEGRNANLIMIPFLFEMLKIHDETKKSPDWLNREFDPPDISWNIGINDHTHAVNITAPQSVCTVYFRPMPGQHPEQLVARAREAAESRGIDFEMCLLGDPVYIDPESPFVREVLELAGRDTPRTVSYGTDGAMFGDLQQMVIFGPGSVSQAHTHDEWIALDQLQRGTDAYCRMIETWCTRS